MQDLTVCNTDDMMFPVTTKGRILVTQKDQQRQKVYDAEDVMHKETERFDSLEEVFEFYTRILKSKRFATQFPKTARRLVPEGGKATYRENTREWYEDYAWRHHKVYGRDEGLWLSYGRERGGSYWRKGNGWAICNRIQLSKNHFTKGIAIHELSHAIVDYDFGRGGLSAHGQEFCHTYLYMTKKWIGQDVHDKLAASFRKHGVNYRLIGAAEYLEQRTGGLALT